MYSKEQIVDLKQTGRILYKIFNEIEDFIVVGKSLFEIDSHIASLCSKYCTSSAIFGYNGFPGHSCLSVNNIACHGIPSEYRLQSKDLLKVDLAIHGKIGCSATNFTPLIADGCRTYFMPDAKKLDRDMYTFCKNLVTSAINVIKIGETDFYHHIDYIEKRIEKSRNYKCVSYFAGHGVGEKLHEDYVLVYNLKELQKKERETIISPGMIFTIEPILTLGTTKFRLLEDKWSVKTQKNCVQYEETVLVEENQIVRIINDH